LCFINLKCCSFFGGSWVGSGASGGAFLPEYVFFALFYGSMILLAVKEYRSLTPGYPSRFL
jgi:hypothetical protein